MTFTVQPSALRVYAGQLGEAQHCAEIASRYVNQHGSFSFHESGLLGKAMSGHTQLLATLTELLGHLSNLTNASSTALNQVAAHYEHTDLRAESALDATYPPVPRPPARRD